MLEKLNCNHYLINKIILKSPHIINRKISFESFVEFLSYSNPGLETALFA